MLEPNNIYLGDCLDLMKQIPDKSIDCVITSPPYDNLRTYNGSLEWSFEIFQEIARELYRVIKDGGVVVWVVGDATENGSETGTSFKQALYFKEIGFNLHDTMIYEKVGLTLNHNRYEQEFEYMFIFSKGKPKAFNPKKIPCLWYGKDSNRTGQFTQVHDEINKKMRTNKERTNIKPEKIKGNIWRYETGYGKTTKDKIAYNHPAIFPDKLAIDHIISWTNQNDLILDPFLGSGTTAIAC